MNSSPEINILTSESATPNNILTFPGELLQEICLNLDWNSIFRTILVSKKFQQILESSLYWQAKCERDFGKQSSLIIKRPNLIGEKLNDIQSKNPKKYAGYQDYWSNWSFETWKIRYRRITIARKINGECPISAGQNYYGFINMKGQVLMTGGLDIDRYYKDLKYLQQKYAKNNLYEFSDSDPNIWEQIVERKYSLSKIELPSRAIHLYSNKYLSYAIIENGELYVWKNVERVPHRVPYFHSLIKYVPSEKSIPTNLQNFLNSGERVTGGFILDDLTGYLQIETNVAHFGDMVARKGNLGMSRKFNYQVRSSKLLKLPIPIYDIIISNNFSILLGKDSQIYLFILEDPSLFSKILISNEIDPVLVNTKDGNLYRLKFPTPRNFSQIASDIGNYTCNTISLSAKDKGDYAIGEFYGLSTNGQILEIEIINEQCWKKTIPSLPSILDDYFSFGRIYKLCLKTIPISGEKISSLSVCHSTGAAIAKDGKLYLWGYNWNQLFQMVSSSYPPVLSPLTKVGPYFEKELGDVDAICRGITNFSVGHGYLLLLNKNQGLEFYGDFNTRTTIAHSADYDIDEPIYQPNSSPAETLLDIILDCV